MNDENIMNIDSSRKPRQKELDALTNTADAGEAIHRLLDAAHRLLDLMEIRGMGDTAFARDGWLVSIKKTK